MDDALVVELVAGPRDEHEAWIAIFSKRLKESRKVIGEVREGAENAALQDGGG